MIPRRRGYEFAFYCDSQKVEQETIVEKSVDCYYVKS